MSSKQIFTALIISTAVVFVNGASGELKMISKPLPIYLGKDGRQLSVVEATKRSMDGESVLECKRVEFSCTDTGNCKLRKEK